MSEIGHLHIPALSVVTAIRKIVIPIPKLSQPSGAARAPYSLLRPQHQPHLKVTTLPRAPTVVAHQLRFCRSCQRVNSDMGRVLAIEPEASKAEALRQIVRNDVGAEFVLVTSAYAAVVAINRQLPDLVLFSESISDRHRERVVDHLKSVSRNGTPPTLSIPALRNGDRATFVSQIGKSLGKANGTPPAPPAAAAKAPASAPPPVPSGKRDFFATAVEAPKTHDIDPVELE